jgi:FkbM family methyltransferase
MDNKLILQREAFLNGQITKPEYFERIYTCHEYLFDYSEFMKDTNVSKIEIEDDSVVLTCRNSQIKLICTKGEKRSIPLTILSLGDYESEELNMQLQLINDGDIVFDIGGNIGWYAMHVAKAKPLSTVHSFEPVPCTFSQLNQNISLNNIENVVTHNFGFSDKIGDFEFFFDPVISGNASLTNVADKKDIQKFVCKVTTLDKYAREENRRVDFIKCDVEGAELFVFQGGMEIINQYKPIIFTEMLRKWSAKFNYHPNDIINLFKQYNYQPYTLSGERDKLCKFYSVDENTLETNYFFLHKEKHASVIERFVGGIV